MALTLYVPTRWLIVFALDHVFGTTIMTEPSSFTFIVFLVLFGYVLKLGVNVFWISSYNFKYSVPISIVINVVYYLLALSLEGTSAQDGRIKEVCSDFRKHLSLVFGRAITDDVLNSRTVLLLVLSLNVVVSLVLIPAVIKFGHWYTKTLQEVYYDEDISEQPADPEVRSELKEKERILKEKSKKTIRLLNVYLVSALAFLFFSHRYCHEFMESWMADALRVALMTLIVYINASTLKDAIEFDGSFAYKYLSEYLHSDDVEQRKKLKQKIVMKVYLIWYHKFHYMLRVIIPLILFLIIIDARYIQATVSPSTPIITETHCGIDSDEIGILENLYKCETGVSSSQLHQLSRPFVNGVMVGASLVDSSEATKDRISRYGLVSKGMVGECVELLLWYSGVSLFAMTVIYILFLRKTVYEL